MPAEHIAGKLGRLPVKPEAERYAIAWLSEYAAPPAPTYPVDVSKGITDWGMDGNDTVGDCGPAAFAHDTLLGHGAPLDGQAVVDLYFRYTHNQDVGVNLADFLLWLFQQGYIEGFAPVKLSTVDAVMAQLDRGVILGVSLTDADMDAFNNGQPWTGTRPDPNEGHAILKIKATAGGTDTVVTWGADQQYTAAWGNACIEEAWALVTKQDIGDAAYAALLADLSALPNVHVVPPPTPAPPPPSPTPTPTPSPSPEPPPFPGCLSPRSLRSSWRSLRAGMKRRGTT